MKNYEEKILRAQKENTLAFLQGLYDEALTENQKAKTKFQYRFTENGVDIKEAFFVTITPEGEKREWGNLSFEKCEKYADFFEMLKTLEFNLGTIKRFEKA